MRRTYRTLAVMAALAIVAGALAPMLTQGLWDVVVTRVWGFGSSAVAMSVLGMALSLTCVALVTGAMSFAVVVAAQTGRKGWLAALAITGGLAVFAPIIVYYYSTFMYPLFYKLSNPSAFFYPYSEFYGVLIIEAAPPVIAAVVALVFALTGDWRAGEASRVATEA